MLRSGSRVWADHLRFPLPWIEWTLPLPRSAAWKAFGLPGLVFLCSFALLWMGLSGLRLGEGELVRGEGVNAQDEAVYSYAARGMARSGDWLTPRFLGRPFLYKPPAVYWLSGLSVAVWGEHAWAYRLPAAVASSATMALVAAMAMRAGGKLAGVSAWLVLLGCPWWMDLARRNLTDPLYCLGITVAMAGVRGGWWFAAGVAMAILAKGVGGAVPLAVAALVWFTPWAGMRRSLRAALVDWGRVALLAGPWFVAQMWLHPRWFFEEFIRVEVLAWGLGAAPQVSAEPAWWFYGKHLMGWQGVPILAAVIGSGVALARRERGVLPPLAWAGVMVLAIGGYSFRHATYLMPLVPAVALLTAYAPRWCRWLWVVAGVALSVSSALAWREPRVVQPQIALLEERVREGAGRPLLVHGTGDHFHAALLPFPRVRYVFPSAAMPPKGFALDFRSMGIAVSVDEFLELPRHLARFESTQRAWGLRGHEATACVILYENEAELRRLREEAAEYDFLESGAAPELIPARR